MTGIDSLCGVLNTEERLDVYLVANGLKPAATITLETKDFLSEHPSDVIDRYLQGTPVWYTVTREQDEQLGPHPFKSYEIGHSKENLKQLLEANSHYSRGIALGYPHEAAAHFYKMFGKGPGRRYDGALNKAIQKGVEIPSWMAYLSFVPEKHNLIKGKIPQASEEIGKEYQAFVREHNPAFAQEIERNFYQGIIRPKDWV